MAKVRRFHVPPLDGRIQPGDSVALSVNDARHVAVLRLQPGTEIELFDDQRRVARAELVAGGAKIISIDESLQKLATIILGVAWPKGKRAAIMVEKCAELGAELLIPVRY